MRPDRSPARRGRDAAGDAPTADTAEAYLRGEPRVHAEVGSWIRAELRRCYRGVRHEHEDLCQTVHEKLVRSLRGGG